MMRLPEPLILLLAGKSERAGAPKGLREFQGQTWLEEQLKRFRAAGGENAIVVLGFAPEGYLAALSKVEIPGLTIESQVNPEPELGPFSSIQCGLFFAKDAPGFFIQPIDVPAPEPAVWQALSAMGSALAALPEHEGRGGHPVRISAEFAFELLLREPTGRLDAELRALPSSAVARVPVSDPSVGMNLNTPEEWARFVEQTPAPNGDWRQSRQTNGSEIPQA